ncbi:hypothetical protein [Sphingomonas sp. URHD0057]|uniref:hypothetical protein n=1 Tax=Sphingomonas sp. URHD0057 TaxID=1380389 RepID=UPI00048BA713|nr:hypothetical protein [Sphingomonas sp. URHD0057]
MLTESPATAREAEPQVGSEELVEGLMLMRASTLKMIRLQLAMERNDRRLALETVDDLVALDRRLEDYLADVPTAQLMFRRELEVERAALNREKLTLAAEVIRSEAKPEPVAETAVEAAAPDAETWEDFAFDEPRRTRWWPVLVLILLSAIAAAAYWFGASDAVIRSLS